MYSLEQIDFNCFFMSTKNILGHLIIGCNPYSQKFFKLKGLYVAMSIQDSNLHIDMMAGAGGIELFQQIRLAAIQSSCKTITMNTSTNNEKVNKLAKFYKFREIARMDRFYADGSTGIVYIKDL